MGTHVCISVVYICDRPIGVKVEPSCGSEYPQ